MKTLLLTGANGYIARQIYKKFAQTYNIIKLTRSDCDLTNSQAVVQYFNDKYFDIVIHTAAQGGSRLKKDDGNICYYNILMLDNLIDMKYKNKYGRLITLSSGAQQHLVKSKQPYGLSKKIITNICSNFEWVSILRIWNVFNQNELNTRFIKHAITQYINHQAIIILQDKYFDFFHMDDFLSCLKETIQNEKFFDVIDCAYFKKYTLRQIAEIINTLSDYSVPIIIKKQFKIMDIGSHYYCNPQHLITISNPIYGILHANNLIQRLKQTYLKLKNNYDCK